MSWKGVVPSLLVMSAFSLLPVRAAGAATLCVLAALPCNAQSLRGSDDSIDRMYRQAKAERLSFYETPRGVRNAVAAGRLERLAPNGDFTLHKVSYPFAHASTLTFVERLGAQHRAQCGDPLEVTSATRPATRQPANSTVRSVHPTGMAIDLHKPDDAFCRQWLRETLLDLENAGVIEATEEYAPPHFHVAVFPTPYTRYVAGRRIAQAPQPAPAQASRVTTYRVRRGDTLSEIAREHDTTVNAIRVANNLGSSRIKVGDELVIPRGD
jgi:hypothetical protein